MFERLTRELCSYFRISKARSWLGSKTRRIVSACFLINLFWTFNWESQELSKPGVITFQTLALVMVIAPRWASKSCKVYKSFLTSKLSSSLPRAYINFSSKNTAGFSTNLLTCPPKYWIQIDLLGYWGIASTRTSSRTAWLSSGWTPLSWLLRMVNKTKPSLLWGLILLKAIWAFLPWVSS